MINKSPMVIRYRVTCLVLLICLEIFSCTSPPVITFETPAVPENEMIHPEPEIIKKIKTNTLPLLSEKVLFFDDFNNDIHGWKTGDEIYARFQLQKGYYIIDNTHHSEAAFSTIPVELNYNGNFIIESTIVKMAGKGECSYGIAWGCNPETDSTLYLILYKNYVLFGRKHMGKWKTLINWHQSAYINNHNQENKIAIKKNSSCIEVFINEQMIFKIDTLHYYGNNIGFILFGNIMVKADFIFITEYTVPDIKTQDDNAQIEFLVTPGHDYLFESVK